MAHHDLSTVKTEEDITDELLANDEEHKGHCKTKLLISQKKVEALKYQAELYRQQALTTLKRGEICSLQNLVEFNKTQIELSAELQYQELLSMDLYSRLQAMRKIANQLENIHNHSKEKASASTTSSPTASASEPQFTKRTPKVTSNDDDTGHNNNIIPIKKNPTGRRVVNM